MNKIPTTNPAQEIPLHQDLKIGAGPLALAIYGEDTAETRRDIYRNPMGLPFFKHGNFVAGLISEIRATIREMQRTAKEEAEEKRRKRKAKLSAKPRRCARPTGEQQATAE
jgi:hypothetical protein